MNDRELRDFRDELDSLPELPTEPEGEFFHTANSGWIDGVLLDSGAFDQWGSVQLERAANNETRFGDPMLTYTVSYRRGPQRNPIDMTPLGAINLGRALLMAGIAAERDRVNNAAFLAPSASRLVISVADTSQSREVLASVAAGDGIHTLMATFTAGNAVAYVERFDFRDVSGDLEPPEFNLKADWDDDGAGFASLQFTENFEAIDDIVTVLAAAKKYIAELQADEMAVAR